MWDLRRLEEESEVALERRRQQLTQELMREMAGDSHHHMSAMDKKVSNSSLHMGGEFISYLVFMYPYCWGTSKHYTGLHRCPLNLLKTS